MFTEFSERITCKIKNKETQHVLRTLFCNISLYINFAIIASCENLENLYLSKKHICSNGLLKYCNKDCRCSNDADFRPICESSGTLTYYNPCYAGCTTVIYVDNVKIYSGCSCVEDMTGWGNDQAKDGPCNSSKCQIGWMIFEVTNFRLNFLSNILLRVYYFISMFCNEQCLN